MVNVVWEKYQETNDPDLREQLILEYAHIVKYVAGRLGVYLGQHMEFDDLVSYGILGLIDAVDKFDILKGVKFETYASVRIRGAIIDSLRDIDWIPRSLRQKSKKFDQVYAQLESELGREPTDHELANTLGITPEEARSLIGESVVMTLVSLDDYLEQNDDLKTEINKDTPEDYFSKQELRQTLINAIENLTDRERLVVTLHYFEELTLREISKILKVTDSRVSQIHNKALLKMRSKLGSHKFMLFS